MGAAMSWAEDKQRMSELGTGLLVFICLLLVLSVLSMVQMFFILKAINQMPAEFTSEVPGKILWYKISAVVNVILYLFSALALFFSSDRKAVFFTFTAILFCQYPLISGFSNALISKNFAALSGFAIIDFAILLGSIGFLLFSSDVERIYQTTSRKLLTRGVANAWKRIRGRPTVDEVEAASLDRTFK
jgi:hypothetical protein